MAIPGLGFISHLRKSRPKQTPEGAHSFMAGLNQKIFLTQWGEPETQVNLNQLGKLSKLGTMFLVTDPDDQAYTSVWIYKKRNSILLFTKEKLVSHFSFNRFKYELDEV